MGEIDLKTRRFLLTAQSMLPQGPCGDKESLCGKGVAQMLVLSRKLSESIIIDENIHVQVLSVQGSRVRLGITAPRGISILRSEIELEMTGETRRAAECAVRG